MAVLLAIAGVGEASVAAIVLTLERLLTCKMLGKNGMINRLLQSCNSPE